jgi:Zn-dependent M28 family amino/carboxypeptidase
MPHLNRRRFIGCVSGFPLAVMSSETLPESPARPSRTAELVGRYKALLNRHDAAWKVSSLRFAEAVAVIEECPSDAEGNRVWWETFKTTPAHAALFALDEIDQEIGQTVTALYKATPARHPHDLALKLRLWLEDDSLRDDDYPLWLILDELENWPV